MLLREAEQGPQPRASPTSARAAAGATARCRGPRHREHPSGPEPAAKARGAPAPPRRLCQLPRSSRHVACKRDMTRPAAEPGPWRLTSGGASPASPLRLTRHRLNRLPAPLLRVDPSPPPRCRPPSERGQAGGLRGAGSSAQLSEARAEAVPDQWHPRSGCFGPRSSISVLPC